MGTKNTFFFFSVLSKYFVKNSFIVFFVQSKIVIKNINRRRCVYEMNVLFFSRVLRSRLELRPDVILEYQVTTVLLH